MEMNKKIYKLKDDTQNYIKFMVVMSLNCEKLM